MENQSGRCSKYVGEGSSHREVSWECFTPVVTYEVAGRRHSTLLTFRTSQVQFPPDARFAVWVNPENPLEPMEAGVRGLSVRQGAIHRMLRVWWHPTWSHQGGAHGQAHQADRLIASAVRCQ